MQINIAAFKNRFAKVFAKVFESLVDFSFPACLEREVKICKRRYYSLVCLNLNFLGTNLVTFSFSTACSRLHICSWFWIFSTACLWESHWWKILHQLDGESSELLKSAFDILCNMTKLLLSRSWKSCNGG